MKISVVVGTRPEIIKMAPVIRELERKGIDFYIMNTGQHYSHNLAQIFFEQLNLPQAKYNLEIGSGSHAEETAKILIGSEKVMLEEKPDIVLVEGDTNSVFGAALVASKLHIKVGHVEAGLRSYDKRMPEEVNRILTDHCSDYLFAPTENAKATLISENIDEEKVFVTGNTIVDSVYQNLEIAKSKSNIVETMHLNPKGYLLVTIHRQENTDNVDRFFSILKGLNQVTNEFNMPMIYPAHPRSQKKIKEFGLNLDNLILIEPVGFLDFLQLEKNARLILTDSGGVQEESCILGIPCVTMRDNTERWETIEVGSSVLAGAIPEKILECTQYMLQKSNSWSNPFGDGRAAERIVDITVGGY